MDFLIYWNRMRIWKKWRDSLYDPAGQDGAYGDAAAGDVTAQEIDVNGGRYHGRDALRPEPGSGRGWYF